jgi:DNA-binding protein H-NS
MTGFLAFMKFKITNRQFLSAAVIFFYLIPLLFFAVLGIAIMPSTKSWTLFSLGLLLAVIGTLSLTLLLYYWEQAIEIGPKGYSFFPDRNLQAPLAIEMGKVTSLESELDPNIASDPDCLQSDNSTGYSKELNFLENSLKTHQEQLELLENNIESKNQEIDKLRDENQQLELNALQIAQDFADYKLFSEEQLKQKQLQINTLQQMIDDQRTEVEKRQEQIYQLDTKIHDLSYEIKTLLHLNEEEHSALKNPSPPDHLMSKTKSTEETQQPASPEIAPPKIDNKSFDNPVKSSVEASALLRKCMNMAQKLTAANYHTSESSRYREFSSSFYTIDQRRLFDNLRSEASALIIVYSQKENQLLFVNHFAKSLLGWSPEKFIADFTSIMQESLSDWKKALSLLATNSESQARLIAKTKQGQEIILSCQLGVIPTGIFRHYVLGILYPA